MSGKRNPENITPGPGRASKRGGPARPLGPLVGKLGRRVFGRRGFSGGEIIAEWPRVVGENLAQLSSPERIVYPKGKRSGGTLHLRIASGSIAVELQHLEPILIERINGYFGYRAVDRVRLTQAPLLEFRSSATRTPRSVNPDTLQELSETLGDVDDPDLRQSLERLAKAMATQ